MTRKPDGNRTRLAKWLMDAIERKDAAAARRLIARGPDLAYSNNEGLSPLCAAIFLFQADIALALIEAGANVNYQNFKKNVGLTPLMRACFNGDTKVIDALLKKGADADLQDNLGRTALMQASDFDAMCRKPRVVERLLQAKIDVNKRTIHGSTALMMNSSQPQNVQRLLKAGADIRAKDDDGATAYDRVRGTMHKRTAAIYEGIYDSWARAATRRHQNTLAAADKAMTCGTTRNIRPMKRLHFKTPQA